MKLTGTEQERIDAAIAFAKTHRCHAYAHDLVAENYRKAEVPFTEAAEKFCREWDGAFDRIRIYPGSPNVVCDDGSQYLVDIAFSFEILAHSEWIDDSVDELKYWYDPDYAASQPRWDEWCSKNIREKYGTDTVPVAKGGYYYPKIIWIRPNGQLICDLPDNGRPLAERVYDSLGDFIHDTLSGHGTSRIEVELESRELECTMEERIASAIEFAKAHGGFKHCRLFAKMYNAAPLDISLITEKEPLSDDNAVALILRILKENTPNWYLERYLETTLPCRITFVDE
ncbi:MAG: hypothetical protein IJU23_10450 [Proteobacteria bacterium]|nr:hypothetical protein [Pseudomonadota bacterium]